MIAQSEGNLLEIGYFAVRAKAQVSRLLCEYLNLPYKDILFTPKQWEEYLNN